MIFLRKAAWISLLTISALGCKTSTGNQSNDDSAIKAEPNATQVVAKQPEGYWIKQPQTLAGLLEREQQIKAKLPIEYKIETRISSKTCFSISTPAEVDKWQKSLAKDYWFNKCEIQREISGIIPFRTCDLNVVCKEPIVEMEIPSFHIINFTLIDGEDFNFDDEYIGPNTGGAPDYNDYCSGFTGADNVKIDGRIANIPLDKPDTVSFVGTNAAQKKVRGCRHFRMKYLP